MDLIIFMIVIVVLPVILFTYATIMGFKKIKRDEELFTGIESKLRFDQEVERIEQEDFSSIFSRCIISKLNTGVKMDKIILIMPFLPYNYYGIDYFLVDYNGNCVDSFGRYDELGVLSNYAPYNELADALAKEGCLVMRMDMIGSEREGTYILGYLEGIKAWVLKIQEQYQITDEPIVIGHRNNGVLALELMKRNNWKKGVFLCCGLNNIDTLEKKRCYYYLKHLTEEYRILQIDAGKDILYKNKKEKAEDLYCDYKIIKIDDMDYTLRKYHNNEVTYKGCRIPSVTGEFPPIYDKLVREITNYLHELDEEN